MDLTIDSSLELGESSQREPLFKNIGPRTTSHTFRHKEGLLYTTEFAQPALTIMERAIYEHIKSKGLTSTSGVSFAGHSLGEYSALACIGEIMPFDNLLALVFYRGLTMQAAVIRDTAGRSDFAMMAVNPSRVSKRFGTDQLRELVLLIQKQTGQLLEIVNYNIDGQQYVCAGTIEALDSLATTCDYLSSNPQDLDGGEEILSQVVTACISNVVSKTKPLHLKRGKATIPLDGIDVPFHSSFLVPKLNAFRNVLLKNIDCTSLDPQKLIGKYVSNVTARPFDISKECFEEAWDITGSNKLKEILDQWE
jgi:fatty acid synthase subunit beta, fungi type